MDRNEIHEQAFARYAGDGYESLQEMLFAWLVDEAEKAEQTILADITADPARADGLWQIPRQLSRLLLFKAITTELSALKGAHDGDDGLDALFGSGAPMIRRLPDPPRPHSLNTLIDVAWQYEQLLTAEDGQAMLTAAPGLQPLSAVAGLTARATMLLGLIENLQMRDDDPTAPGL